MPREEIIEGRFQKGSNFGFVIPKNRGDYGGDFYVHKNNFANAEDGDMVEASVCEQTKGKKPEAKIIKVFGKAPEKVILKTVEGIYSGGDGNFGFIDVEGQEKGFFVYGKKKNGARDGDKVKAEIVDFNGKEEAIVTGILSTDEELLEGVYKDNERFGFVLPDDKSGDIFIAGSRKGGAENGDRVLVNIIKRGGKNPEGVIKEVL